MQAFMMARWGGCCYLRGQSQVTQAVPSDSPHCPSLMSAGKNWSVFLLSILTSVSFHYSPTHTAYSVFTSPSCWNGCSICLFPCCVVLTPSPSNPMSEKQIPINKWLSFKLHSWLLPHVLWFYSLTRQEPFMLLLIQQLVYRINSPPQNT